METLTFKGIDYEIQTGPKGGKFFIDNEGKKRYVKSKTTKVREEESNNKLHNPKTDSGFKTSRRSASNDKVLKRVNEYGTCCCCGKPLTREDIHFYDLTDYCIDCAIADGIRTSKE